MSPSADHGPGIAAGPARTLFEMFERGMRESATPGVGLGLAICRAIVEAHGGSDRSRRIGRRAVPVSRFTLPLGEPPQVETEEPEEAWR